MMSKSKIVVLMMVLVLSTLALSACTPPVEVPFDQVCQEENNHKTITTDGYFSFGASIYCDDTLGEYRCGLNFNDYPDGVSSFSADVMVGARKNMMADIESGYTDEDLVIKTASGETVGVGDHVVVTGRMLVIDTTCVMEVEKIELPE